ncbi:MAG: peroxiredoxin family protein [Candidatus Saccharicenans sp.]|uniref:peroxiredoxin family protein n=1 Tax=Candidatus Saccharicenans sp. TaxID=2819258 RepID=UPI00404B753D
MKKTTWLLLLLAWLLASPLSAGGSQSYSPGLYASLEEIPGYRQRPLVLVFISLTCHVCWEELFEIKDYLEKMDLPAIPVGVSAESREELENFIRRYSFSYPVIEDRNKTLFRRFRVRLEPLVVILDARGEVFHVDDPVLDFPARRELTKKKILELCKRGESHLKSSGSEF